MGTTGGGVNFLDPRVKNVFRFVSNQFFPIAINANPVNPFFALNIFYVEIIQKGNKCNSNYRRRQVCARSWIEVSFVKLGKICCASELFVNVDIRDQRCHWLHWIFIAQMYSCL